MTQSDAYYRALSAYRAAVAEKRECVRDSKTFMDTAGAEQIKVKRANCTVDEEWVKAIETGLVFIEKAIKEERQFIYSNGEVIPIEKVKNVSRDSVEHLAKHSELITRENENEDLVPDKLYTVERFNDYTVYENRFLYMLLCYLRDFVTIRYQKILDLTNRYEGLVNVKKEISVHSRTVSLSIDMHDERRDDPFLRENNPAKDLIDRMDLILKTIIAFLATPLMESAGKAPMLKPPITKTNVLKMDNNFKGAVALYEYIIAYEGAGYTVEEQIKELSPFQDEVAEDMAEVELLVTFMAYKHGLGLSDMLKASYELDEAKKRQAELKKRTEQIESIRRRLERDETPSEEYILYLEKHVRALQNEVNRIDQMLVEIDVLKAHERVLNAQIGKLSENISSLETEAREAAIRHEEKISEIEQLHRRECAELNERHAKELAELKKLQAEEIVSLKNAHADAVEKLNEQRNTEVGALNERLSKSSALVSSLTKANEALTEENNCLKARVIGLRFSKKQITPEEMKAMTEKENFDELEKQLDAFVRFYKSEWSLTKRKIRKDLLNLKYIKGQSGKK